MTQTKRLTIDMRLQRSWNCLYEIEADEDMPKDLMLARLRESAKHIAVLRARKRLTEAQREKLANLEKWLNSYDIERLQQDVRSLRRYL